MRGPQPPLPLPFPPVYPRSDLVDWILIVVLITADLVLLEALLKT